jgi:Ca-activated chloride channel family protein
MENQNQLVVLSALPSSQYALKGIVNYVEVLFTIKTGNLKNEGEVKRAPLNLSIVLDRSGSMSGLKLKHAKEAIIQVVEALSDDDILHLVVYDDNVEVIFENEKVKNKSLLFKQIQTINDQGSTNLWGGLEKGAELASKYHQKGYSSQVFLFSDGLVNVGKITAKGEILKLVSSQLHEELRLKISSFGLGNDFDEELMRGIAERGTGTYFFIEGSETIPKFVSSSLGFLLNTVANDAILKLRGQKGSTLSKIYGHNDLTKGAFLGDLRADNTRQVLSQFEVRVDSNLDESMRTKL